MYINMVSCQKKSAEHNLLHIINYVSSDLNDGNYCIGVFLDLKKAFDVCSHSILLKKLSKMGFNGNALKWFKTYLSGRSQKVDSRPDSFFVLY
jgi:hypothetical protein